MPSPEVWIPADDVRIFWFVQTYHDLPRLRQMLGRLRKVYPESRVLVVSDGDQDPAIGPICNRYSVEFTLRSRLMGVEHGGEPVQKMLEAFLETDANIVIKIDPDTFVRRRFSLMPCETERSVYGTLQFAGPPSNYITSIQGGCIIIPRQAAMSLVSSTLLESEQLKPPMLEWVVNENLRARTTLGMTSHDWTLGWACRELGLLCKDHPEVFSRSRPSLVNGVKGLRAAVSHPHFEIRQLTNRSFYDGLPAAVRRATGRALHFHR